MKLSFDQAFELLKKEHDFKSLREKDERDILVAAIDNLIDFAAASEYKMVSELPDDPDVSDPDAYEEVCERYNLFYASVENETVAYAASIAAWWISVPEDQIVTFMTQGDERVRPWHLSLEGVSYPKSSFPSELIPPIEWRCRCYLVESSPVFASLKNPETWRGGLNPVFKESLATKGRIFASHPYFDQALPFRITEIVHRLKSKFLWISR